MYLRNYKFAKLEIAVPVIVISLLVAMVLGSRAFVIGYMIALTLLISYNKKNVLRRVKFLIFGGILLVILLLSFGFKVDSTLGRMLIYKISFKILKENIIYGVGLGQFDQIYGNYQRDYFKQGDFTTKELLLADNTKYAFNDYLQFIIETGLSGLFILLIFLILLIYMVRVAFSKNSGSQLLFIAFAQITALLIAALFTHVFERPFFQCLGLISLVIIVYHASYFKSNKKLAIATCIVLIISVCGFHYGNKIIRYEYYKQYKEAKELSAAGYITEAVKSYQYIFPYLKDEVSFLHEHAQLLFLAGYYNEACKAFESLLTKDNGNITYQSLAECYHKLGRLQDAEECYLNAIYMVPNRFTTRYNLFNFYNETNQRNKALAMGKSILELPVKIPSAQVETIKRLVQENLRKIN